MLVGNGLSVAFNPSLNLRVITQEMVERIGQESDEGSDVVAAMKEIAERALPMGAETDDDFEVLVGAFGSETRTLSYLRQLAELVSPQDESLKEAIKTVSDFAEQVRDTGLSHVLQVIFERSHGYWEDARHLHTLVAKLTEAFNGRVVFGNLNYDTLLLSALLATCQNELADMGHGWRKTTVTNKESDVSTQVPALRTSASEFPTARRVQLLHLHGSLTFWSNQDRTIFAKLDTEYLSTHAQWEAVRKQETGIRPVVVLANQRDKSAHVTEFPFSLAYEMFGTGLANANHWLVIGYSFRDECVNDALRAEFSERTEKPKVLVVTYGEQPTVHEIERAFGWGVEDGSSQNWLSVNRAGANGMTHTGEWLDFSA